MEPTIAKPKIDFFVIGAARSGTTSIFRALSNHPDVFQNTMKEPRFFSSQNWSKGWDWYNALYAEAEPHMLCGDYSPSYSNAGKRSMPAERIAEHYPDARIIYMVRNPIECAISNWRMSAEIAQEEVPFIESLSNSWKAVVLNRTLFHQQYKHYLARFPKEQILVVPLERTWEDSAGWMTKIQRHIGLPEDRLQQVSFPHTNRSDSKPARPKAPLVPMEDRQTYVNLVKTDARRLLKAIGEPATLWDISVNSPAWEKGLA